MVLPNPNRPLVGVDADFTLGPPNRPGANAMSLSSRGAVVTEASWRRGRQNELGRCEAGTASVLVHDPNELLNPASTGSPFNSGANRIQPYRAMQLWAMWNMATGGVQGNILNSANLAPGQPGIGYTYGFDPSFEGWTLSGLLVSNDGIATSSVTTPPDGTYPVTKVVAPASGSYVAWIPRVIPGGTYTLSVDVYAPTGTVVSAYYGSYTAASTVTNAYQTISMTVTAGSGYSLQLRASAASPYPATFYYANLRVTGLMPGWSQTAGSAMSYNAAQAHSGAYSCGTTFTAAADAMSVPMTTAPDITYTMSSWVYAPAAGSVIRMSVGGSSASSTVVGGWQQLVVTFTATDAVTVVSWSAPAGTFPVTAFVDDIQLECGAAASAWSSSGPLIKYLHTGWIARYAQSWADGGTRGIRQLESEDALSALSRVTINQSYAQTIAADSPAVYVPYSDQTAPTIVQRITGGQPMQGYTNLGSKGSPSVNFGGDTFLDGSKAISLVQQNANPPVGDVAYTTYAGTYNGQLSMNTQSFTIECWVKFTAGTTYFGMAAVAPGENVNAESFPRYYIGWLTSAGALDAYYADPNGIGSFNYLLGGSWWGYPDGQWHYLSIAWTGGGKFTYMIDNGWYTNVASTGALTPVVALNNIFVNATTAYGDPVTTVAVANMAAYSTALTTDQMYAHYRRGTGYLGEFSGNRANRLLTRYWSSNILTATGRSAMSPDHSYNGKSLLAVLQDAADTEDGLLWADGAGTVRFDSRDTRYINSPTAAYTFGERPGELPYTDLKFDYDPNKVYSQANISNPAGTVFIAPTPPPVNPPYGPRILTKTAYLAVDWDVQQAANFYAARYANAKMRISKMTIDPASNPALWRAALSLDVGDRITINRRTSAGVTISGDFYIEQLQGDIRGDPGSWTVTYQLSQVFNPTVGKLNDATYGVLGSTTVCVY
jgi:hypothetical protein